MMPGIASFDSLGRSWERLKGYGQRQAAAMLYRRSFQVQSAQPLISFTFDDFPKSALVAGGEILNQFGTTGTYYVSLGLADQIIPAGRAFTVDDLPIVIEHGHELGCHTFAHCDASRTPSRTFARSVSDNQRALDRLVPGVTLKTLSYPINVPRPLVKARVAERFLACRGGGQTFNAGIIDLNLVSAFFVVNIRGRMDTVKAVIDRSGEAGGWLIFATHDVARVPSPYGCTPQFFEEVVRYATMCGARVVTITRALELMRAV
jgi:peptidoglycan/xylan/chitin deacetylase (PgdA/CDA1 family)